MFQLILYMFFKIWMILDVFSSFIDEMNELVNVEFVICEFRMGTTIRMMSLKYERNILSIFNINTFNLYDYNRTCRKKRVYFL